MVKKCRKLWKWSSQVVDLKLWTSEKLWLRSNISWKVAELQLRKCFLQVAEFRLRTKKKLRVPTSNEDMGKDMDKDMDTGNFQ